MAVADIWFRVHVSEALASVGLLTKAQKRYYAESVVGMQMYSSSLNAARTSLRNFGIAGAVAYGTMAGAFYLAYRANRDFNTVLLEAVAVGRLDAAQKKQLSDMASMLAIKYGKSAVEIIEGTTRLIKAGFSWNNVLKMLGPSMEAAIANNIELEQVTNTLTVMLSTFNISAERSAEVLNKLYIGARETLIDFEDFYEGVRTGAGVAAMAGVRFEEFVAYLSAVSQSAISAEMAGTGFVQLVKQLLEPMEDDILAFEEWAREWVGTIRVIKDGKVDLLRIVRAFKDIQPSAEFTASALHQLGFRGGKAFTALALNANKVIEIERLMGIETDALSKAAGTMSLSLETAVTRLKEILNFILRTEEIQKLLSFGLKELTSLFIENGEVIYDETMKMYKFGGAVGATEPQLSKLAIGLRELAIVGIEGFVASLKIAGQFLENLVEILKRSKEVWKGFAIILLTIGETVIKLGPKIVYLIGLFMILKILGPLLSQTFNLLLLSQYALASSSTILAQNIFALNTAIDMNNIRTYLSAFYVQQLARNLLVLNGILGLLMGAIFMAATGHQHLAYVMVGLIGILMLYRVKVIGGLIISIFAFIKAIILKIGALIASIKAHGAEAIALNISSGSTMVWTAANWGAVAAKLSLNAATIVGIAATIAAVGVIIWITKKIKEQRKEMEDSIEALKNQNAELPKLDEGYQNAATSALQFNEAIGATTEASVNAYYAMELLLEGTNGYIITMGLAIRDREKYNRTLAETIPATTEAASATIDYTKATEGLKETEIEKPKIPYWERPILARIWDFLQAGPEWEEAGVKLQYGGIIKKPVFGLLGERGPEAVIPLLEMKKIFAEMAERMQPIKAAEEVRLIREIKEIRPIREAKEMRPLRPEKEIKPLRIERVEREVLITKVEREVVGGKTLRERKELKVERPLSIEINIESVSLSKELDLRMFSQSVSREIARTLRRTEVIV